MVRLKNILVATDFSEAASVALAYGRDFGRTYSARLHVLHVVQDVVLMYAPEMAFVTAATQSNLEKVAERHLQGLITDDDRRTLDVVPVLDRGINFADVITRYAKANDIDLIVTGTHGRGAVKQFLMGSVAERIVRTAPCPVLTVHAHEREFLAPDAMVKA